MFALENTRRIVVKIGTNVLTEDGEGFSLNRLNEIVSQLIWLWESGCEVFLVTSGAVGLGREALKLGDTPLDLVDKQACAAVGQSKLMEAYQQAFQASNIPVAQVLLTAYDLANRKRYLNIKETFERLIGYKAIPIINENDCVSVAELLEVGQGKSFGDNDMLSALVASKLEADLLILLTNVGGIYTKNPLQHADAERFNILDGFEALKDIDVSGGSTQGRGGMSTKIKAAQLASLSGVNTVICNGLKPDCIRQIFNNENINGTVIRCGSKLSGKKRWVGFASGYEGVIVVNPCAVEALIERNTSLLPIGILDVIGDFSPQAVVSIQTEANEEIGRGMSNFSAEDIRRIQGCHSSEILAKLGKSNVSDVVIQRDYLVIFETII